jgi:hypothetical protein
MSLILANTSLTPRDLGPLGAASSGLRRFGQAEDASARRRGFVGLSHDAAGPWSDCQTRGLILLASARLKPNDGNNQAGESLLAAWRSGPETDRSPA